ncbi:Hypothetical predicted protein [Cloeon dipterum]|uniref:Major facilitator superfamily (MFS) profile domain-containing protein n=1 Tax=Cloeon dipterum TaxID=197152 RepID=A0A8S1CJ94_9INSE|nr:Hypothetical predicted protein [Cloeon dipterum]
MSAPEADGWRPRDGGLHGWLVVAASFCVNGLVFGLINSYSVIYARLQETLIQAGETDASSMAALVGSLTIGATFSLSPVAGILTDMLGLKRTTLVGGTLAVIGMTLSSFLTHTVEALCVTYGIIFGIGASLAYTPSLAVLGLHFREKLGLVNGIVCTGSSVFTIALPPILSLLLEEGDLPWALRFLAIAMAGLAAAGFLFTPPKGSQATAEKSPTTKKQSIINRDNWRVKRYVIWTICIPCSLFGYFVPYVHMVKFVEERFPTEDGKILIMCIGLTSGLGRLIFGKIGDLPRVDRILLQQVKIYYATRASCSIAP